MAEALAALVDAVVDEAMNAGRLSGRAPGGGDAWHLRVRKANGQLFFVDHSQISVQDLSQELMARILERYLSDSGFQIETPAYIATGLVLLARTELRAMARFEELGDRPTEVAEDDELDLDLIRACWFHVPGGSANFSADAPALSLRFLYTSLRIAGGATPADVSRELGLHRSRITALKSELADLIPAAQSGGFLPLPPCRSVTFGQEALHELGIARQNPGLVRRPGWLQTSGIADRKAVLWRALGVAIGEKPTAASGLLLNAAGFSIAGIVWATGKGLKIERFELFTQQKQSPAL